MQETRPTHSSTTTCPTAREQDQASYRPQHKDPTLVMQARKLLVNIITQGVNHAASPGRSPETRSLAYQSPAYPGAGPVAAVGEVLGTRDTPPAGGSAIPTSSIKCST